MSHEFHDFFTPPKSLPKVVTFLGHPPPLSVTSHFAILYLEIIKLNSSSEINFIYI